MIFLPLITESLRLINNLIESKPPELRRAETVAWYEITKPLWWGLLPEDKQKILDKLMARLGEKV